MPEHPEASGEHTLGAGDVVSALFPMHLPGDHEQQGYRPAVVVGIPELVGLPRFALLIVVPMTTDRNQEWRIRSPGLYPRLKRGTARLRSPSVCLLDQVRAIGAERVRNYRGTLDDEQYGPIREGLLEMMDPSWRP